MRCRQFTPREQETDMDDEALLAELLDQEKRLVFDRFDNETGIALGMKMLEIAKRMGVSPVVDVARGEQRLFYCALAGTSADNEFWVERKKAVVRRFGHSSYYMGQRARIAGRDFNQQSLLDPAQFGAHGGCFPILVERVGMVGTATISGLPQADDHRLVVTAIEELLAEIGTGEPRADVWTA
jgi:uncharacterized protein (UPF0303 family)